MIREYVMQVDYEALKDIEDNTANRFKIMFESYLIKKFAVKLSEADDEDDKVTIQWKSSLGRKVYYLSTRYAEVYVRRVTKLLLEKSLELCCNEIRIDVDIPYVIIKKL